MAHSLNPFKHQIVHHDHIQASDSYSLLQIEAEVEVSNLSDRHQTLISSLPLSRREGNGGLLTIEICSLCGFTERVICDHGLSYWTHRPDCPVHTHEVEEEAERLFNEASHFGMELVTGEWSDHPQRLNFLKLAEWLPPGLIQHYTPELMAGELPSDDCTGCLLLCPVCGSDGT